MPRPPPAEFEALLAAGFRYAMALVHDHARAKDLLQEACLGVVRADGDWTRGYLFAAIRTRRLDQERRAHLVAIDPVEPSTLDELDDGRPLESLVATRDEVGRALSSLREDEREAVYLAWAEGYSITEVAALVGRPRNTILSLVRRAREKLRRALSTTPLQEVAP